jgi:hypothetical protein
MYGQSLKIRVRLGDICTIFCPGDLERRVAERGSPFLKFHDNEPAQQVALGAAPMQRECKRFNFPCELTPAFFLLLDLIAMVSSRR